ncbi:MAG TPA: arylesterase [Pyrinomonadaceae bacterium]|nr:arylesterase [Pyrinomonadaceae bacterium]
MLLRLVLASSILLGFSAFAACGNGDTREPVSSQPARPAPDATTNPDAAKIIAFGDSLTAGLGLAGERESYPSLLQEMLRRDGFDYEVVNAGVSGHTSADGLARIDWVLDGHRNVRVLVLELGANDLLRGRPVSEMKKNLSEIIRRAKARGARVLLAGMIAPTNQGREYQRESAEAFKSLAAEHGVTFLPFFLDRVAGVAELNQPDGIHPNPQGTKIVAETVYRALRPMLEEERARN